MESSCGKSCACCLEREALGCHGCRPEYDAPGYTGCDIAQCCKARGHAHCGTCQYGDTCYKLSRRELMPEEKPRNLRKAAEHRAALTRRSAFLGRWLWVMFWLIIPNTLGALLSAEPIQDNLPELYWAGIVLQIAVLLGCGGILLLISRYSRHFGNCIWYALAGYGILLLAHFLPQDTLGQVFLVLVLNAVSILLSLLGIRQRIEGYGEILAGLNDALAGKMRRLWPLYRWCYGIMIVCLIGLPILQILSLLFVLALLVCMCWLLALSIMMMVNEYRSAKTFREYRPQD